MPAYERETYRHLIRCFLKQEMSADDFERHYLATFKTDNGERREEEFLILDRLFAEVDAYCGDASIRAEDDLDEQQLRECARGARGPGCF